MGRALSSLGPLALPHPHVCTRVCGQVPSDEKSFQTTGNGRPESAARKAHSGAGIPGHQELRVPPTPPHPRQRPSGLPQRERKRLLTRAGPVRAGILDLHG